MKKIKSIPGGGVQIKYLKKWDWKNGVIQKATFRRDVIIENDGPFIPPLVKPQDQEGPIGPSLLSQQGHFSHV